MRPNELLAAIVCPMTCSPPPRRSLCCLDPTLVHTVVFVVIHHLLVLRHILGVVDVALELLGVPRSGHFFRIIASHLFSEVDRVLVPAVWVVGEAKTNARKDDIRCGEKRRAQRAGGVAQRANANANALFLHRDRDRERFDRPILAAAQRDRLGGAASNPLDLVLLRGLLRRDVRAHGEVVDNNL